MTDIRVTQAVAQVLVAPAPPPIRVTHAVAQVLVAPPPPPIRVTTAVAQVLYRITYDYIPPSVFTNLTFRPL